MARLPIGNSLNLSCPAIHSFVMPYSLLYLCPLGPSCNAVDLRVQLRLRAGIKPARIVWLNSTALPPEGGEGIGVVLNSTALPPAPSVKGRELERTACCFLGGWHLQQSAL